MKFTEAINWLQNTPPNKAKIAPKGCGWPCNKYVYLSDRLYVSDPTVFSFLPEVYQPTLKEILADWEILV